MKRISHNGEVRSLFHFEPGDSKQEVLEEISSDEMILETIQALREDNLNYHSLEEASDETEEQIVELERSFLETESLEYLKVCKEIVQNKV